MEIEKVDRSVSDKGGGGGGGATQVGNDSNIWKTERGLFFEFSSVTESLPESNVEIEIITLKKVNSDFCHETFPVTHLEDGNVVEKRRPGSAEDTTQHAYDYNNNYNNSCSSVYSNDDSDDSENIEVHTCTVCLRRYKTKNGLQWHQLAQHPNDPSIAELKKRKVHSCHLCSNEYDRKSRLQRHMLKHNLPLKTAVKTETGSSSKNTCKPVNKTCKPVNKTMVKQECHTATQQGIVVKNENYKMASNTHIKNEITNGDCDENSSAVQFHLSPAASGDELIQCNICLKMLRSGYGLRCHMLSQHCKPFKVVESSARQHIEGDTHQHESTVNIKEELMDTTTPAFDINSDIVFVNSLGNNHYQCKVCLKDYKNKGHAQRHVASHFGRTFNCNICSRKFGRADSLKKHKRELHAVDVCNRPENGTALDEEENGTDQYTTPNELKSNMKKELIGDEVNEDESDEVNDVKIEVKSDLHDLQDYDVNSNIVRVTSNGSVRYQCKICLNDYKRKEHARRHVWVHLGRTFTCDLCGKIFNRPDFLRDHEQSAHGTKPEDKNPYACSLCTKRFPKVQYLRNHTCVDEVGEDRKVLRCTICDKKYTGAWCLTKHMRREHGDSERNTCKKCNKAFVVASDLKAHVRSCYGNYKYSAYDEAHKLFKCTICDKKYAGALCLEKHTAALHGDNKHTRAVHGDDKRNSCKKCYRVYLVASHLKRHISSCKGGRNGDKFKCSMCDKKYMQRRSLRNHVRRIHDNDKMNTCMGCDKSFHTAYHLKRHMVQHCHRNMLKSE